MRQREELEALGKRVLNASRTELFMEMRFLESCLGILGYEMDLSTRTIGTDALNIRFNPQYCFQTFMEQPGKLNRTYLHMIVHCLFRHMFTASEKRDTFAWDVACDIATEAVLEGIETPCIYRVYSDFRHDTLAELKDKIKVLTAEKLYQYFLESNISYEMLLRMSQEFGADDHSFWQRLQDDDNKNDQGQQPPKPPKDIEMAAPNMLKLIESKDKWEKQSKKVLSLMENEGMNDSGEYGEFRRALSIGNTSRTDYRQFLKKFMVVREESGIDMDSFDMGMYNFGLSMYHDMPLIEENEFREAQKVEELAIVIDTSASTMKEHVQRFLDEAGYILFSGKSFFKKVDIHIIQCDDQIQSDIRITDTDQLKRYVDEFEVSGGYGTDFVPAFNYIDELRRKGEIVNLKGLMYFTDGYGHYPQKVTDYETTFVFDTDLDYDDTQVPNWAMKLYFNSNGDDLKRN